MSTELFGLSDEIKLIQFGKTFHPLTFLLGFLLGSLLMIPIIDSYGVAPGLMFCMAVLGGVYIVQRYLASYLKNQLLLTLEIIIAYQEEIRDKVRYLSGSIERDIAFIGINTNDTDDVRKNFSSLVESVYQFRRAMRMYHFIDFLFLSFGETEVAPGYRGVVQRIDNALGGFFSESLQQVQKMFQLWILNHTDDIASSISQLQEIQLRNISSKSVFDLSIRRLESHKIDLERAMAHI